MNVKAAMILMMAQTCLNALSHAHSSEMIGRWKVNITFSNGENRSLQFDAQASGRGSLLLLNPLAKAWGPGKPMEAKWTQGEGNSVTFSGLVEFPLGNVGIDRGTLKFNGKFETETLITGEVVFLRVIGDQPSKQGTFKAARAGGG
jgi:hypothetical protein